MIFFRLPGFHRFIRTLDVGDLEDSGEACMIWEDEKWKDMVWMSARNVVKEGLPIIEKSLIFKVEDRMLWFASCYSQEITDKSFPCPQTVSDTIPVEAIEGGL